MLCPNNITSVDLLCSVYSNIKRTDSFTHGCMNTFIGFLSIEPDWLSNLRIVMGTLRDTCSKWQISKPKIWSQLLLSFVNYYTTFKGFTETSKKYGDNKEIWISALEQLKNELINEKNAYQVAENQFQSYIDDLQKLESLIASNINDVWDVLSDKETKMVQIASEFISLQYKVNQLQSDFNSSEIANGKSYTQSVVKISYSILSSEGVRIPYLNSASLLYTISDLDYGLITNYEEINLSLEKIADFQVKASAEAQALAVTKSILQMITNLKTNLIASKKGISDFSQMWLNEIDKINQVINFIHSGIDPSMYIDLKSMPSALATWKALADYVPKLIEGFKSGKDIILEIKK